MRLPFRLGLRGELTWLLVGVMLVVAGLFGALWLHTQRSNADARELSADAVRELAREGLLMRGHTLSSQLADAATNPMYYLDLAKLGELARATLRQPDVVYVIIHDAEGQVLILADVLVAKEDDEVLRQRSMDLVLLPVGQRLAEVDAADLRAEDRRQLVEGDGLVRRRKADLAA